MTTSVTRYDLSQLSGISPKLLIAFTELFVSTAANTDAIAGAADATGAIQDGTVITLSPNAAFNNERVLTPGPGITLTDNGAGSTLVISADSAITLVGGYALTFNLSSDVILDLPATGRIPSSSDGPYADDAAAAAAGIAIGGWYAAPLGVVQWRQV